MNETTVIATVADLEERAVAKTFLLGKEVDFLGTVCTADSLKIDGLLARKWGVYERGDASVDREVEVIESSRVAQQREAHLIEIGSCWVMDGPTLDRGGDKLEDPERSGIDD